MENGTRLFSKILYAASVVLVVFVGWSLRMRAVDQLPIDYDEDDYLRAAQLMAAEIQGGDIAGLTETNYRPEHPPLAKLGYGVAVSSLPEASLVPDVGTDAPPADLLPEPHFTRARETASLLGTLEVLLLALINPLAGLFLGIHTFTIKYHSQIMLESLPALTSALAVPIVDDDASTDEASGHVPANASENIYSTATADASSPLTGAIANTGGSQSHPNLQPYTCVNYIICLQGVFPSRS